MRDSYFRVACVSCYVRHLKLKYDASTKQLNDPLQLLNCISHFWNYEMSGCNHAIKGRNFLNPYKCPLLKLHRLTAY